MADGPTEQQFQELITQQKKTNQLLMTDHERMIEEAYVENEAREAAAQEQLNSEEKTRSLLNILTLGMLGTGGAAKKEEEEQAAAGEKKRNKLFGAMADGIGFIGDKMREQGAKAGKGIMAMIKGTLFAGVLLAIIAFLNSETWQEMKTKIVDELVPKMQAFYYGTIKPFADGILTFIKDPSWKNFKEIFNVDNPAGLVAGIAGISFMLAPGLTTAVLKTAVTGMKTAFTALGPVVTGIGGKLGEVGKGIRTNVLTPIKNAITSAGAAVWKFLLEVPTKIKALGVALNTHVLTPLKTAITNAAATAWQFLVTVGQKITALATAMKAQILVPLQTAIKNAAVAAWGFLTNVGTALLTLKTRILANVLAPLQAAVANAAGKLWVAIKAIPAAILTLQAFFVGTLGPMLAAALVPLTPFIAVAAVVVAAAVAIGATLYALYQAFEDFRCTLEETGSIGEALKVGISKFMGTLLGFIPSVVLKLVGWVAGLFGFDDFKEKVQNIDVIQFISDKIKAFFDLVSGWVGKLLDFTGITDKIKSIFESVTGWISKFLDIDFSEMVGNLIPDSIKDSWLGRKLGFGEDAQNKYTGGSISGGQPYIVGEHGPELIIPSGPGRVINAMRTDAMQEAMLRRSTSGIGGGGQAIIAPTNVANQQSTNITHTTKSLVNPDQIISTVNKAA